MEFNNIRVKVGDKVRCREREITMGMLEYPIVSILDPQIGLVVVDDTDGKEFRIAKWDNTSWGWPIFDF